ncbi:hypothetical protein C2U72_13970, partial [Prosthecomicrobium hirschii]|uniref:trypsin-like serine protease n=1 Tax=Prosthecodimorpha hirschii TaxID=665126 RepID=UPI001128850D
AAGAAPATAATPAGAIKGAPDAKGTPDIKAPTEAKPGVLPAAGAAAAGAAAAGAAAGVAAGVGAASAEAGKPATGGPDPQPGEKRELVSESAEPSLDELAKSGELGGRVIGGAPAKPGQWPGMVAIMMTKPDKKASLFCGGTLIDAEWVLTAAHCVVPMSKAAGKATFTVREGTADLDTAPAGDIEIASMVAHADYSTATFANDIALLKLARPAKSARQTLVRGSEVPGLVKDDAKATLIGFGRTSGDGSTSPALLQLDVGLIGEPKCREALGERISGATVCAARPKGFGACNGDSGGPLFALDARGRFVQVGVVSYGPKGCTDKLPDVYASVGHFEAWIKERVPAAAFAPLPEATKPAMAAVDQALVPLTAGGAAAAPSTVAQVRLQIVQGDRLKIGSFADLRILSSTSGRLVLFSQGPDGQAHQIYPSKGMPSGRAEGAPATIEAGRSISIPSAKARQQGYRYKILPPAGPNRLIAVVVPERAKADDLIARHADGDPIPDFDRFVAELIQREVASRAESDVKDLIVAPLDRGTATLDYEIVE